MVELETLQLIREIVTIFGGIAGVSYYVMTVRNAQKNRMIEFVFQRVHERDPEYQKMARGVQQMGYGWNTMRARLDELFEVMVEVPRIRHDSRQTVETLINEETLLLAKYLRDERKTWFLRVAFCIL